MKKLIVTVTAVGSVALAQSVFASALSDFALFSLNNQVEVLTNVWLTNPQATLSNCPPQDCATEAGKGYIGTGLNGIDTSVGNSSIVTGIRTGSKVDNAFADKVTVTGDIVSSGPVKFGNGLQAGSITSGEDVEAQDDALIGDIRAGDEVEIGNNGVLGDISATRTIQVGMGTTTGTQTTGVPLTVDPMVPMSLPVNSFTGGGTTFVNGQVFTPGQYFFDSYLPADNQGVTFDFSQDPTGKIELFVEGSTILRMDFDITVRLGTNSCTVAEIFHGLSSGSCTDPFALRSLAGQVVIESHGLFQIRDGANFFGTGIVPVALNGIGIEVKGQGLTGFVIGALYAIDKVKLWENSLLQYVGMAYTPGDACPNSDLNPTVVIGGCDSGVDNELFVNSEMFGHGCTISDLVMECAEGARNHGQFVSCVAELTNDLKKDRLISGPEKGAIQSCAAQTNIL